jgi:formylglycine-generating enzyme required for sulfatase activity
MLLAVGGVVALVLAIAAAAMGNGGEAPVEWTMVVGSTPTATEPPPPTPTPLPATIETEVAPGVTMGFVQVPAGPFLMGSSEDDPDADDDEFPRHELTLPTYYVGRTEVTNAQFRPFVEGDGYTNPDYWSDDGWAWREDRNRTQPYYWDSDGWNGDEQPVVGISWYEAMAYTRWLSAQTGEDYRLPTEAEWEKAACGTDDHLYPWGNEPPNEERANFGTPFSDGGRTVPVGSYPAGASPYGALDMAGNVLEWTRSVYQDYPYDPNDGREDISSPAGKRFTLRGGGHYSSKTFVRCAARLRNSPDDGFDDSDGLRVLLSPRASP